VVMEGRTTESFPTKSAATITKHNSHTLLIVSDSHNSMVCNFIVSLVYQTEHKHPVADRLPLTL